MIADYDHAVRTIRSARRVVALTGAGISVESGIPDFRSPGGLWSHFDPAEYATLSCFLHDPEKAWRLYRELGRTLLGREPNPAHFALARMAKAGHLAGIVTQNVDGLHQRAGNPLVLEMHGEHGRLQCLGCDLLEPFLPAHLEDGPLPRCRACGEPLKPNVVLFEESVREMLEVARLLDGCDLLLVVGTSAEVYPAAGLPLEVLSQGGSLLEFNLAPTRLTGGGLGRVGALVEGPAGVTLPILAGRLE